MVRKGNREGPGGDGTVPGLDSGGGCMSLHVINLRKTKYTTEMST